MTVLLVLFAVFVAGERGAFENTDVCSLWTTEFRAYDAKLEVYTSFRPSA